MDNNKGLNAAVLVAAIAAFLISAASLYYTITLSGQVAALTEGTEILNSTVAGLAETEAKEEIFILREYEGVIGVFDNAGVLTDVIDVQVKSLPETDREMLEAGIYAFSRGELIALIEDYTG